MGIIESYAQVKGMTIQLWLHNGRISRIFRVCLRTVERLGDKCWLHTDSESATQQFETIGILGSYLLMGKQAYLVIENGESDAMIATQEM